MYQCLQSRRLSRGPQNPHCLSLFPGLVRRWNLGRLTVFTNVSQRPVQAAAKKSLFLTLFLGLHAAGISEAHCVYPCFRTTCASSREKLTVYHSFLGLHAAGILGRLTVPSFSRLARVKDHQQSKLTRTGGRERCGRTAGPPETLFKATCGRSPEKTHCLSPLPGVCPAGRISKDSLLNNEERHVHAALRKNSLSINL
jgi:hypothetical protein